MTWTFLFMMVALKVPIAALIYIVWWAVHQTPESEPANGDGGTRVRPRPHPRRPPPRLPRRGPHAAAPPSSPPRIRTVRARARRVER